MKIFVISDVNNKERSENIKTQFANQEGNWKYEIVEAVMNPSQPQNGTVLSFKKCIELAKKNNHNEILILEDDFDALVSTAIKNLIDTWNNHDLKQGLLLGGLYESDGLYFNTADTLKESFYGYATGKISGLHCVCLSSALYNTILQAPENYHLDYFLSMGHTIGFFPDKIPIYTIYPLSVLQKSFSSANGNNMEELNRNLHLKYKLANES